MRILIILVLCLTSACSWQGVISEAEAQLGHWRLADQFTSSRTLRWRLPHHARLVVVSPERAQGTLHQPWNSAAQTGLDRVFVAQPALGDVTHGQASTFYLTVEWPEQNPTDAHALEGGNQRQREFSLLGMHTWPTLPRTGHINVILTSPAGMPMHQATLDLSPKLWGRDWHDTEMLERAFFDLAENLRGS